MKLKTIIEVLTKFAVENEQDEKKFSQLGIQSLGSYFRGKKEAYQIAVEVLETSDEALSG